MTSDTMLVRDLVLAGAAGIAIAAACGLRAFLPLLALGLGVPNLSRARIIACGRTLRASFPRRPGRSG